VYDNLINRLNLEQSTGPELLERDFQASIVAIFNKGERLGENKEELVRFIEKTKRRNISEKIRKSVKILEDIIEIYDKDPYSQCEILNDKLFHLKLYETNVYNHLDQVFKALEKINVEVAIITQNSARHKKQIDGQNSKSAMGLLRDMEKIDYVKAREIYKSLNLLPGYLKRQFDEFLADFMDKLEMCDKYTNRIKELKLKYAKTKIFTIKVDPLIAEFEKTVMEYCRLEFSNEEHKRDLEKYAWVVRCNAALEGRIYDGSGLTLESWKKLLDNVSDWGGSFASAVEKKYNTARMFVKEVERIKEWMSSQRGDKSSLPTLEKAEAMLRELNKSAKEVDVSLEKNTLEGIMAGVQTRINSVVSGEKITQHELTSVIEFLKRSPLNLTEEISMLIGKEKKVHEFMVKVRETKPDQLVSRKREINNLYEKLAIKIMDWEEILLNLGNEERVIEKINQLIVAGAKDFEAVQGLRDSYKALKYHRDVKTEIKLMYVYTQLLKTEFEKRQNNAEMNEEMKPIIDYVLLRALVKEGENLLARIKNSEGSLPYDANGLSENVGFIRELCNDTKKFLEHNILGLNIQQLKQRSIEKYYKNFVDISGTIIDHKINLEIQERELAQMEVVHRVEKEVTPKIPSNIIEAKLFKEKDSLLTRAMPAEKRVVTPEKEAPDWGKAVVENVTPRSGNHPFMDEQVAMILKPPAEPMEISDELRNYYIRSWKKQLESNPHLELSAVDIVLEANNLEKTLYKRLKSNPKNYDALCSSITNTLRNVGSFNQDNHAQVHHTRVQGKQSQT
jgi:hypothetical protein